MKDHGFLRAIRLDRRKVASPETYPFCVPAVRHLERLEFAPGLTTIIGENGVGKSTLIEAIAVKWGFNAEGGSKNFRFRTKETHSSLNECLVLEKGVRRPTDGFFLRAESFYGMATEVERLDLAHHASYGGKSLHEQSHGEAFLALLQNRLRGNGLYIFDEPEAALSPKRQLSVLVILQRLLAEKSQVIMATHSPILMGFPDATIYEVGPNGMERVEYEQTDHFRVTRDFLNSRERILGHLLREDRE
ncbi:MAG: AAA family ATPase [Nibricoccus sp.]